MEEKKLNFLEYNELKKAKSIVDNKKIFVKGLDLYKMYIIDPSSSSYLFDTDSRVNRRQIEYLSALRKFVKLSHLPRGIVSYKGIDLGIIYDYFPDYKSFLYLHNEDKEIIFDNIRYAIDAMNELCSYNIYNSEIISNNILYKGRNVELIDLDGRYVSNTDYKKNVMYSGFLDSILVIFKEKLLTQYSKEDTIKIIKEIKKKFSIENGIHTSQIDEIENLKLIK